MAFKQSLDLGVTKIITYASFVWILISLYSVVGSRHGTMLMRISRLDGGVRLLRWKSSPRDLKSDAKTSSEGCPTIEISKSTSN